MAGSKNKQISFVAATEEVAEWEDRAERQDLSRSEWARQKIRAGMRLWEANGGFNHDEFDQLLQGGESKTGESRGDGSAESQIKQLIKRNLSVTEPVGQSELEAVMIDVMNDALYDLQQKDEIEHIPGEGYRQLTSDE